MILGRDFDPARFQILDGLINAVMAEFQLFRITAKRLADHLMPQTNAEYRRLSDHVAGRIHNIGKRGRIARTVRQQHPVGLVG